MPRLDVTLGVIFYAAFALQQAASGDDVKLKSGAAHVGEVVRDNKTESFIWFRYRSASPNAAWTTEAINRADILSVNVVNGDQGDGRKDAPAASARQPKAAVDSRFEAELHLVTGEQLVGFCVRFEPPSDIQFIAANAPTGKPRSIPLTQLASLTIKGATANKLERPSDLVPILLETVPPKGGAGEIIVLALTGRFSGESAFGIGQTITPGTFQALVDAAMKRSPRAIVLDIDSLGGETKVMRQIIDRVLDLQGNKQVLVASWPDRAASAAALLSLACVKVIIRPTTKLGAATTITGNGEAAPEPNSALEQKVRAWEDINMKRVEELCQRSPLPQLAMQHPERKLWFHPQHGFADKMSDMTVGWKGLDTSEELPLVLTGEQLLEIKFAVGMARNKGELASCLNLPVDTPVITLDLNNEHIQNHVQRLKERIGVHLGELDMALQDFRTRLDKAINKAKEAQRSLEQLPDKFDRQEIDSIVAGISECLSLLSKIPNDRHKILMAGDHPEYYPGYVDFHLTEARNLLKSARSGLRSLQRQKSGGRLSVENENDIIVAIDYLIRAWNGSPAEDEGDGDK